MNPTVIFHNIANQEDKNKGLYNLNLLNVAEKQQKLLLNKRT